MFCKPRQIKPSKITYSTISIYAVLVCQSVGRTNFPTAKYFLDHAKIIAIQFADFCLHPSDPTNLFRGKFKRILLSKRH